MLVFLDPNADPNGVGSGKHYTAPERMLRHTKTGTTKIVEIWLSHSEQADAALREQLRPIYQEYNGKKYTVAVFQSGTEDLYEQTHQLLLYNRNRAAELEAKQQAPVME